LCLMVFLRKKTMRETFAKSIESVGFVTKFFPLKWIILN
jgi:hypothetical protein